MTRARTERLRQPCHNPEKAIQDIELAREKLFDFVFANIAFTQLPASAVDAERDKWILVAPDGRRWCGESGRKAAAAEQRERIPATVALKSILDANANGVL